MTTPEKPHDIFKSHLTYLAHIWNKGNKTELKMLQ